jgi:hypothetical protein
LVWIAISSRGLSKPLIAASKGFSINSKTYIKDCIESKLIPFVNKHHSDQNYWFWQNLAPAHYSTETIAAFEELHIQYIEKEENPPNILQLRKIETFWSHLKNKVYSDEWEAKPIPKLIAKIERELKTFDANYCQNLLAKTKILVRKAADSRQLSAIY